MLQGSLLRGISLTVLLCTGLFSCSQSPTSKGSYLHRMMDTLSVDRKGNTLIYTINPNDCISCLNGFKIFEEAFGKESISCIYVISVNRAVEKQELLKRITCPDLNPAPNKLVLWGKEVLDSINGTAGQTLALSSVFVYNYEKDTLLLAKPVREISNMNEVREKLALQLK